MSLSIALLAYKEAENLKVLLPKIIENIEKAEKNYNIIVVDTEKTLDDTPAVCEEYGCRYVNQRYPGFGGAFRTAIEEADKKTFLILDSDGSHNPIYIPDIINKFHAEKLDIVIGSRYVKGGKTNDSFTSIVMSHILNTVFRIFLGIPAKDISTDFRMYHTKDLKSVSLKCTNYDVLQEVLVKIQKKRGRKLRYGEVPITFDKRIYGESKRRLIPFIISYMKTLIYLVGVRIGIVK